MTLEQLPLPLEFRRLLQCSAAEDPDHHIDCKETGYWRLRITINVGRKLVGKRLVIALQTKDVEEARLRRDIIIRSYEKLGLEVCDRRITRPKPPGGGDDGEDDSGEEVAPEPELPVRRRTPRKVFGGA